MIEETGEFVINLTTRKLARAADYCGVKSGRDTDKIKDMKLHLLPGKAVKVPMLEESPVNIECRVGFQLCLLIKIPFKIILKSAQR